MIGESRLRMAQTVFLTSSIRKMARGKKSIAHGWESRVNDISCWLTWLSTNEASS
jgi:hypothetical protein